MSWISMTNPPQKKGIYWVYPIVKNQLQIYLAMYWDGSKFTNGAFDAESPTHYMPMKLHYPEPPKE